MEFRGLALTKENENLTSISVYNTSGGGEKNKFEREGERDFKTSTKDLQNFD